MSRQQTKRQDEGSVLVILFFSILPLTVLVGAAMTTMKGRQDLLLGEVARGKALLAAESGVDEGVARAAAGALELDKPFTRVFSSGMSFTVLPTHLLTDKKDNDGDGQIDEWDEDVIRLVVTGQSRFAKRRIVADLQRETAPMPSVTSAIYLEQVNELDLGNADTDLAEISGEDVKLDGSDGLSADDVAGIAFGPMASQGDVFAQLDAKESTKVKGMGGTPSVDAAASAFDIEGIADNVKRYATVVLDLDEYADMDLGNAKKGEVNLIFRDGDLILKGDTIGAGIMVVTGSLVASDDFHFDGLIIVGEELWMRGSVKEYNDLFGVPVTSTRAAFVMDTSGSMGKLLTQKRGLWTRMDEAKKQLARAVDNFSPYGIFNVIGFESTVSTFEARAGKADDARKGRAKGWINDMAAKGGTNVYDAVKVAFQDTKIDTIYLMSDGDPTRGAITDKSKLADEIRSWNVDRGIKIHTIAIGYDSWFMKRLADESKGTYMFVDTELLKVTTPAKKKSKKSAKSFKSKSKSGSKSKKSSKSGSGKSGSSKSGSGSSKAFKKSYKTSTNRSGLGDGTNPGKGSGRTNSKNTGTDNPNNARRISFVTSRSLTGWAEASFDMQKKDKSKKSGSKSKKSDKSKKSGSKSKKSDKSKKSGSKDSKLLGEPDPEPEKVAPAYRTPTIHGAVIHRQGERLKMEGPSKIRYSKEAIALALQRLYSTHQSSNNYNLFAGWQEVGWREPNSAQNTQTPKSLKSDKSSK